MMMVMMVMMIMMMMRMVMMRRHCPHWLVPLCDQDQNDDPHYDDTGDGGGDADDGGANDDKYHAWTWGWKFPLILESIGTEQVEPVW